MEPKLFGKRESNLQGNRDTVLYVETAPGETTSQSSREDGEPKFMLEHPHEAPLIRYVDAVKPSSCENNRNSYGTIEIPVLICYRSLARLMGTRSNMYSWELEVLWLWIIGKRVPI